jgi:hypothetical protein
MILILLRGVVTDELGVKQTTRGAGKDTVIDMVCSEFEEVRKVKFASELKNVAQYVYQLSHDQIHGPNSIRESVDDRHGFSGRTALEVFGTHVVRRDLNQDDRWIKCAEYDIMKLSLGNRGPLVDAAREIFDLPKQLMVEHGEYYVGLLEKSMEYRNIPFKSFDRRPKTEIVIVTDNRFDNETIWGQNLKNYETIVIDIHRTVYGSKFTGHISDDPNHKIIPDVTYYNSGSLEDVRRDWTDFINYLKVKQLSLSFRWKLSRHYIK